MLVQLSAVLNVRNGLVTCRRDANAKRRAALALLLA